MVQTRRFVESIRGQASTREGGLARPLDQVVARLPSDTFLWLGWGSLAAALALWISGRHRDAAFVGLWAPTFLIHGIYVKLVKQLGHDQYEQSAE